MLVNVPSLFAMEITLLRCQWFQLDRVAVSLMNPIHMTELVVKTWAIANKLTNIAAE